MNACNASRKCICIEMSWDSYTLYNLAQTFAVVSQRAINGCWYSSNKLFNIAKEMRFWHPIPSYSLLWTHVCWLQNQVEWLAEALYLPWHRSILPLEVSNSSCFSRNRNASHWIWGEFLSMRLVLKPSSRTWLLNFSTKGLLWWTFIMILRRTLIPISALMPRWRILPAKNRRTKLWEVTGTIFWDGSSHPHQKKHGAQTCGKNLIYRRSEPMRFREISLKLL